MVVCLILLLSFCRFDSFSFVSPFHPFPLASPRLSGRGRIARAIVRSEMGPRVGFALRPNKTNCFYRKILLIHSIIKDHEKLLGLTRENATFHPSEHNFFKKSSSSCTKILVARKIPGFAELVRKSYWLKSENGSCNKNPGFCRIGHQLLPSPQLNWVGQVLPLRR